MKTSATKPNGGSARRPRARSACSASDQKKEKARQGLLTGSLPWGYRKGDDDVAEPDPERAPYVVRLFELYATGAYSLDRLTEAMTSLGLTNGSGTKFKDKPLSRHKLSRKCPMNGKLTVSPCVISNRHVTCLCIGPTSPAHPRAPLRGRWS